MILNSIEKPYVQGVLTNLLTLKRSILFFTISCGLLSSVISFGMCASTQTDNLNTKNRIHKDYIKTVQIRLNDSYPSYPVVRLNSNDQLSISFDDLSDFDDDYYYKIIHCSHDWIPSDLESNEYINGFQELNITEIEPSFNSAISYTHYDFNFPNDMMSPKLSGNYLLIIYPDDDETNPIISARIIVYEELVRYRTRIKESSTIRERTTSQEVDFDLVFNGYNVTRPYEDIYNVILQNFNWNTAITDLAPIFVKNDEMSYDYGEENNFKGGNEYRFFATSSINGPGPRMQSLQINAKTLVPEVHLKVDQSRAFKLYTTLPDINGDYKINSLLGFDDDLEAEYCEVSFYLEKDTPVPSPQEVHVFGSFNMNTLNRSSLMTYNYQLKRYELKTLLKQGYYNYIYALKDSDKIDLTYMEGSHFQTENDFHIFTYDSNSNLGYDRVIGFLKTNTFNK